MVPALNPVESKKNYKWFVGIDVSKRELDFAVLQNSRLLLHSEIVNIKDSIRTFLKSIKNEIPGFRVSNALFCMEAIGYYAAALTKSLQVLKANLAVESPLKIKRSSGLIRGKDDKSDAVMIAAYAQNHCHEIKLWEPRRRILEELKYLSTLKTRVQGISLQLNNPIDEQELFIAKRIQRTLCGLCNNTVKAADTDLKRIGIAIDQLIASDERLSRLIQLITSVKCVGKATAVQIILTTNEFRSISSPKKFACYAGIVPFKSESGIAKKKQKVSRIANCQMKSLLHLCAMGAVYHDPELKAYFMRKTKIDGKSKMSVVNAVRYKLILRVFACVQQDRCYVDDYIRPQYQPLASFGETS